MDKEVVRKMVFPKDEELIDKPCIVCKGIKKWNGETCFHCNGVGTTKWPKRCPGDELRKKELTCGECKFPPNNPRFEVGDRIIIDAPTLGGHGKRGVVNEITYTPCRGNGYGCMMDDGVPFSENDGNDFGNGLMIRKIGRVTTLGEF